MTKRLPSLDEIDNLLVVKTSSIGDVVHALPVIDAIKRAKPSLKIDWVVRRRCSDVLIGNPNINRLFIIEENIPLRDLMRLGRELRARKYQCALDMQGLVVSGLITWLSGAPIRIGNDRNREMNWAFLTHPIVMAKMGGKYGDPHAVDILFGFAEALGVHQEHREFEAQPYLASDGAGAAAGELAALPRPTIALNVGASSHYKRWPIEHWTELMRLMARAGYGLVFIGDKKDAEAVSLIKPQIPIGARFVDVSGRTSLRELAAVLKGCDVLVSADTGPMHLGVAVGTPTVALFGSTNADRTGPYGARNIVLTEKPACSPCYRNPTCNGRVDCMQAIKPESVLRAVKMKLSNLDHPLDPPILGDEEVRMALTPAPLPRTGEG